MKTTYHDPKINIKSAIISEGKKRLFKNKKICVGGMAKEIEAALIKNPCAVGVGVFSITESKLNFETVLGILNSDKFSILYRKKYKAKELANGYLAINKGQLKNADFPTVTKIEDKKLSEMVSKYLKNPTETRLRNINKFIDSLYDKE